MLEWAKSGMKIYSIVILLIMMIRMFYKADVKTATLIPVLIYILNI